MHGFVSFINIDRVLNHCFVFAESEWSVRVNTVLIYFDCLELNFLMRYFKCRACWQTISFQSPTKSSILRIILQNGTSFSRLSPSNKWYVECVRMHHLQSFSSPATIEIVYDSIRAHYRKLGWILFLARCENIFYLFNRWALQLKSNHSKFASRLNLATIQNNPNYF